VVDGVLWYLALRRAPAAARRAVGRRRPSTIVDGPQALKPAALVARDDDGRRWRQVRF